MASEIRGMVSRRAVLVGSMVIPLAACGVRLESDAPRFLPDPSPDPAGPAILAERQRVAEVIAVASPLPAAWRAVHATQLRALDAALLALDPPVTPPGPSASAPPARPSQAATPRPPTRTALADLADREFVGLDAPGLAGLDLLLPRSAAVVVTSHAQRAVALEVLRAGGGRGLPSVPATPWSAVSPTTALRLVEAIRATAYAIEVAAAQSPPANGALLLDGLRHLRAAEADLGADVPDLPPRPLGYVLPRRVATPAQARALAWTVLDRFVDLVCAQIVPTATMLREADTPDSDPASTPEAQDDATAELGTPTLPSATLLRLITTAEVMRLRYGGPARPLPGLRATSPAPAGPTPRPSTSSQTSATPVVGGSK